MSHAKRRYPSGASAATAADANRYMRDVGREPMLSREEERDLALRSQNGDDAAVGRLVRSHLRFVVKIARGYRNYGVPMSDLVQEGTLGLMHAVRKFDPHRDARLATYAMWWIRAAIQDHVLRSWSFVRIGTTAGQRSLFFNLRRKMMALKDNADVVNEEFLAPLAKRFGMPLREAVALARRATGHDHSLNRRLVDDEPEEWLDRLADSDPTPEEHVAAVSERRFVRSVLARALATLPPRERLIIRRRYLLETVPTREALGRELGISKERVRQLETRALERLRQLLPAFVEGSETIS